MPILFKTDNEHKQKIVKEVLAESSEWFGLPKATEEYVEQCQQYPLWYWKEDLIPVSFISLKETSQATGEIYCMKIKKNYH